MSDEKKHWHLVVVDSAVGFANVNFSQKEKAIGRLSMKKVVDMVEGKFGVGGAHIVSISYLGHMTEEEFENA